MSIRDADILLLAAGFGARLRPLTDAVPKPLVQVAGRSLIDRNLQMLAEQGARRVIINLHHLGGQIKEVVGDGSRWGLSVDYSQEPVLLDTGGAVRNVAPLLEHDQLITVNSDILLGSPLDLGGVLDRHRSQPAEPISTMVLRRDPHPERYGEIGIDSSGRVVSFVGAGNPSAAVDRLMFIGVQVLARSVIEEMRSLGQVFSITTDFLKPAVAAGRLVNSYLFEGIWFDVGTPERLQHAEAHFDTKKN